MKTIAALLALCIFVGCSTAVEQASADPKPAEKKPETKLAIGDKAPALKPSKWLQGAEIKEFAPGKVYVIEFWATWCPPCIKAMPHLSQLQKEYKDKGLVVVGLTNRDENGNSAEKVAEFVQKHGKRLDYTFAYNEDNANYAAYMDAAGRDGIPCSFVIGKDGKIAYIGHPMELDEVLPKVLDSTWKGQADIDAISKLNDEFEKILMAGQNDPEKALQQLIEFGTRNPSRARAAFFSGNRLIFTLQAKKYDDAKTLATEMIAESVTKKSADRAAFAAMLLSDKQLNPEKKHVDLVLKGIDTALQFEDSDIGLFIQAAGIYFEAGEKAKAATAAEKAIALAPDAAAKDQIQKLVEKYRPEKK